MKQEYLEMAKNAASAEELLALAKENGIQLTQKEAEVYFTQLHPQVSELSDDELDNVSGGGIYTSAAEAAKKVGGKVIGVDVDQQPIIDGAYGSGMTVTSAMKGLYPTTIDTLTDIIINGKWDSYKGKIDTLGMVSGSDATLNYVQLGKTQFAEGKFTEADYAALVKAIFEGTIKISNDIAKEPAVTNANVQYLGNLK